MREVWVQSNRLAALPVVVLCEMVGALAVVAAVLYSGENATLVKGLGFGLFGAATLITLAVVLAILPPRVWYQDGKVFLHVRAGAPYAVPVEVVECFLMGQGPAAPEGPGNIREAVTLSLRIAERALDWQQQPTLHMLAGWCGGYVTLRGTWCEPLTLDTVHRLNKRLAEVKQGSAAERSAS